jgi:hypothetical protein
VIDVRRTGIVKSGLLPRQSDFAFRAADCRSPPVPEFLYTHQKEKEKHQSFSVVHNPTNTHADIFLEKEEEKKKRKNGIRK